MLYRCPVADLTFRGFFIIQQTDTLLSLCFRLRIQFKLTAEWGTFSENLAYLFPFALHYVRWSWHLFTGLTLLIYSHFVVDKLFFFILTQAGRHARTHTQPINAYCYYFWIYILVLETGVILLFFQKDCSMRLFVLWFSSLFFFHHVLRAYWSLPVRSSDRCSSTSTAMCTLYEFVRKMAWISRSSFGFSLVSVPVLPCINKCLSNNVWATFKSIHSLVLTLFFSFIHSPANALCDFVFGCYSFDCFFFPSFFFFRSNCTHKYAFEIYVECHWKLHAIDMMFVLCEHEEFRAANKIETFSRYSLDTM